MGAWGIGHFENDAATDWLFDLENDGSSALRAPLMRATEPEALEANEASEALAAAVVIAAARDGLGAGLPERAAAWLSEHRREVSLEDQELAARAVTRVATDSELLDLWREADGERWSAAVQDLRARLVSVGERSGAEERS